MGSRFRVIGLVAAAALAVGWLPVASTAAPRDTTAACMLLLGSVTAGGDHREQLLFSTSPPTLFHEQLVARDLYSDGQVQLSGPMNNRLNAAGPEVTGYVVLGGVMYRHFYAAASPTGEIISSTLTRIGGGWSSFAAIDESYIGDRPNTNTYGLRGDGVLFRWTARYGGVWQNKVSYPGFAAVKSMALISQTRTYDTFLANTRGGALYTIHIPTTSPMKPVVKLVRRSTWQVFESLVAARCGQYGTIVLGIDKDGTAGYLYAVGHGNGTATVIRNLGKVPVTLDDPTYFHWTSDGEVTLPPFGE